MVGFLKRLQKNPAEAGPRQPHGHRTELATLAKVALRFVPTSFTGVMMTTAMPAAMSPYSIAVAPDSFLRKFARSLFIAISPSFCSAGGKPITSARTYSYLFHYSCRAARDKIRRK